jgi:lysophospholipase L1-like esterase
MIRWREIASNSAVVLGTLALVAIALEFVAVPIVDDGMQYDLEMWKYAKHVKAVSENQELGHAHRPNAAAHLMGVDVRINALGLRDRNIPVAKDPNSKRILMLGDSITFGWGVPAALTASKRLETALRESGANVDIINTGVGNYNTRMEVEYFMTQGRALAPDIVVLNYFINDAEPIPSYANGLLERHSKAFVYFSSRLDSAMRLAGIGRQKDWKTYYRDLYEERTNPGGWTGVERSIAKLAAYCRENKIKLLLVNYPELRELDPYPFANVTALLRGLATRLGVTFVDLLDSVRKEAPETLWVSVPDPHPNARANELFAAALLDPVKALLAGDPGR